ncbi:YlbF family regulator [Streptococcus didelphis]|uniref:YlbF family regulator n=1 Tax=Streptococcus didelphis TaxID=102886 RepID=A0ABY9LK38_9STRE|nr:YlbF family regulator [Streptococcus didelphis]WMB28545.1 YlbF family regulator [Streptococcus didelphis]WMB29220.1 YlbF family regulator [Streptococcus didelphis]
MLVINEELLAIEEAIDDLVSDLKSTEEYQTYQRLAKQVENDSKLQVAIAQFQQMSEAYASQSQFVRFRPEIRSLKKALLMAKKDLDLNPQISALRVAEVNLQKLLAHVSEELARSISSHIFVDTGLPLAPKHEKLGRGIYNNIKEKDR